MTPMLDEYHRIMSELMNKAFLLDGDDDDDDADDDIFSFLFLGFLIRR